MRSSSISSANSSNAPALVATGSWSRLARYPSAFAVLFETLILILCFVFAIFASVSKVYHLSTAAGGASTWRKLLYLFAASQKRYEVRPASSFAFICAAITAGVYSTGYSNDCSHGRLD